MAKQKGSEGKGYTKRHEGRKSAPQTGLSKEERQARIARKQAERAQDEKYAWAEPKHAAVLRKVNAAIRCRLIRAGITPDF